MKKFINDVVNFKITVCFIFIGEIALYMLSKTIIEKIYIVEFLDIIYLSLTAICLAIIVTAFELDELNKRLNMLIINLLKYLTVTSAIILANCIFKFYLLSGTEYLYFALLISISYFAAQFGIYLLSLADVKIINNTFQKYKNSKL